MDLDTRQTLSSRREFLINFLRSSLRLRIIGSNPNPKKGKGNSSPTKKPICGKCGGKHYGDCLKGMDNYFGCGKSGHKVREFPNVRGQEKGSDQAQASGSNEAPKN